jgi:hypothetical protein
MPPPSLPTSPARAQRAAQRQGVTRPPGLRRDSALFGLLISFLACSSADRSGHGPGSSADAPPGSVLDLIRRSNDLALEVHEAYCASCPCGAFLDVSAETEECLASVIDEFPQVRSIWIEGLQCTVAFNEDRLTCLASASDCDQANVCNDASDHTCEGSMTIEDELWVEFGAELQQRCDVF